MRERESELERDFEFDTDTGLDSNSEFGADTGFDADSGFNESVSDAHGSQSYIARTRSRIRSIFSLGGLGGALVLGILGMIAFSVIPFIGVIGNLLGIGAGAFVYGLLSGRPRYIEAILAGSLVGGGSVLLSYLFIALLGTGTTMLAAGLLGGAFFGAVGHYFGRDLRDGLTRDIGSESDYR